MSAGQHATGEKGGILRSFLSLLIMIAFVLGLSWALRTYVFTAYEIPSGSMEETIMTGDMRELIYATGELFGGLDALLESHKENEYAD